VIAVVLLACTTLPKPEMKSLTLAYEPRPERRLVAVSRDLLKGMGPETSGLFMLLRNDEALRWRLLLADLAEETLDIQVFIWKDDASSDLLLDRVIKAADRGVRV
jgi:putative cardiolipin synthase